MARTKSDSIASFVDDEFPYLVSDPNDPRVIRTITKSKQILGVCLTELDRAFARNPNKPEDSIYRSELPEAQRELLLSAMPLDELLYLSEKHGAHDPEINRELKRRWFFIKIHLRNIPAILEQMENLKNAKKEHIEARRKTLSYIPKRPKGGSALKKAIDGFFWPGMLIGKPIEAQVSTIRWFDCYSVEEHQRQFLRALAKVVSLMRLPLSQDAFVAMASEILSEGMNIDIEPCTLKERIHKNKDLRECVNLAIDGSERF
ncbi:MAG: hypothetical protein M1457_08505 [bacterium]|nr:hypothetical protein [bacterium]